MVFQPNTPAERPQAFQPEEPKHGLAYDMAASLLGPGLMRGIAGMAAQGGDSADMVSGATSAVAKLLGIDPAQAAAFAQKARDSVGSLMMQNPAIRGGQAAAAAIRGAAGVAEDKPATLGEAVRSAAKHAATGTMSVAAGAPASTRQTTAQIPEANYKPQTVPGEYMATAGNFAPAAAAPGSALARVTRVALPALASETAGQVTKGTPLEVPARIAGGIFGGIGAGAVQAAEDSARRAKAMGEILKTEAQVPEGVDPRTTGRAADYVAKLAEQEGVGPDEIGARAVPNKDIMAGEAIGERGKQGLRTLARRPGETPAKLAQMLYERDANAPDRVLGDLADATGLSPAEAEGNIQALVAKGRAAAAPLYDKAYAMPAPQTAALDDMLANRPSMKQALKRAVSIAAEENRDPASLGFDFDADGNVAHVRTPSVQTLDYVKRGLDDYLDSFRDRRTGELPNTNQVQAVVQTLKDFRGELTNPATQGGRAYGEALNTAGDYLSANDAFQRGSSMFGNPNVSQLEFQKWYGALSDGEKRAAVAGIANDAYKQAQNGRLTARGYLTNLKGAKLATALGPSRAAAFARNVQAEREMAGFSQTALSARGSPTPGALSESALQDQYAGNRFGEEMVGRLESGQSPVGAPLKSAWRRLGVGLRNAGMAGNPKVLDEQGRLLMQTPQELARTLRAIETGAGPRISAVPGLAPSLAAALRSSSWRPGSP